MSDHEVPSAHEWEAALEQLEVQLNRAERIGTTVDAQDLELALPASLSTIPRYLLDRAQSLIERQQLLASIMPDHVERPAGGGTLHERVGHMITGPREPITFDLFEAIQATEPEPTGD